MGRRVIDVIDVNRRWSVWVGSRRHGYRIGTIRAPESIAALRAARLAYPGIRVGFVEEERW